MRILVGLSGGVDSSVTAFLLKQQGHDVIGATMSIWGKDGMALKSGHKNACYGPDEQEDIEEAGKIAKQLNIPFYVFNCVEKYEEIVLNNFKSEYIQGRTPNPCVWCNALVKFGILPELAKSEGIVFDKFATGHYARVEEQNGIFFLKRGRDIKKDQSYFLYRLTKKQLEKIKAKKAEFAKTSNLKFLKKYGKDLTEEAKAGHLDTVIGREKEIERVVTVLARRTKSNPVLIGEAGVGKTAIVEGLAARIAEQNVPGNLIGKHILTEAGDISHIKIMFYTIAQGFSMVIDNKLRDIILDEDLFKHDLSHDQWMIWSAFFRGKIVYDNAVQAKYRRHESTATKTAAGTTAMLANWVSNEIFGDEFHRQCERLKYFLKTNAAFMNAKQCEEWAVLLFTNRAVHNYFKRLFFPRRIRPSLGGEIALRINFLLGMN